MLNVAVKNLEKKVVKKQLGTRKGHIMRQNRRTPDESAWHCMNSPKAMSIVTETPSLNNETKKSNRASSISADTVTTISLTISKFQIQKNE